MKPKGKVAVFTSGACDIGRAICIRLAKKGAKTVVNYFGSMKDSVPTLAAIKDVGVGEFQITWKE